MIISSASFWDINLTTGGEESMHRPENIAFLELMIARGIFLSVDDSKRNLSRGLIVVPCSDCDQWEHMVAEIRERFRVQEMLPRFHPLALNGGALLIPDGSPLPGAEYMGRSLLECIQFARHKKGIELIHLYAHYPCGVAGEVGLSLEECVDLQMQAETRVKAENPGMRVDSMFHVDWEGANGSGRPAKETFFISHQAWLRSQNDVCQLLLELDAIPLSA